MLLRDRASRFRFQNCQYVQSTGLARRARGPIYTVTNYSRRIDNRKCSPTVHFPPVHILVQKRSLSGTSADCRPDLTTTGPETSPSSTPNATDPIVSFDNSEGVRHFLKRWSQSNQKTIKDNAPEQVQLGRNTTLPSSLFIDKDASSQPDEDLDVATQSRFDIDHSALGFETSSDITQSNESLQSGCNPGDVVRLSSSKLRLRPQLALCLATRGLQMLFLLADGRWLADSSYVLESHIIRNFASAQELSFFEPHLPLKAIEYQKSDGGGKIPHSATGEVPHEVSQPILRRFAALNEDIDNAKRKYHGITDHIYESIADESEWKFSNLVRLLKDHASIDFVTLSEGEKMFIASAFSNDEHFVSGKKKALFLVGVMPRRAKQASEQVIEWARSYQDAAACAAAGKGVTEDLAKNPLAAFISKARRLVSKSRKIRTPTLEAELGPTFQSLRPPDGRLERRSTGEEFTSEEKKIIEFVWLTCVKRPLTNGVVTRRHTGIASLIIRAVGAYPNFKLEARTGFLFLKELGCIDPWIRSCDYNIYTPDAGSGLHQEAKLAKEKAESADRALDIQPGQEELPFPDTLAHLRVDRGDMEVFCIDSARTRLYDDGISIEPSQERPDCHWIHVHLAHPSSFIPRDSPVLAQVDVMGVAFYNTYGSRPLLPPGVLSAANLRRNKPALTISTLLHPDGSVKDVKISPSTIRNIVKIDADIFAEHYQGTSTYNTLKVGEGSSKDYISASAEYRANNLAILTRCESKLRLLQKLFTARWDARYREDPNSLDMAMLPFTKAEISLEPHEDLSMPNYERLFRSEHVVGDPQVRVRCEIRDFDGRRQSDQSIKLSVVTSAMLLASESTARWAAERNIPFTYAYMKCQQDFPTSKLNSLGPYEAYLPPIADQSTDMQKHLALNMDGLAPITNPLRRGTDLIHQYQIDAFLKAEALHKAQSPDLPLAVDYPYSKIDLQKRIDESANASFFVAVNRSQIAEWTFCALYRAFYFGEAPLPEVWDIMIDNPARPTGLNMDSTAKTLGLMLALGHAAIIEASEQGWEKLAKFRQFLPCKIVSVDPQGGQIICQAVGPPSDTVRIKDLRYPELQDKTSAPTASNGAEG